MKCWRSQPLFITSVSVSISANFQACSHRGRTRSFRSASYLCFPLALAKLDIPAKSLISNRTTGAEALNTVRAPEIHQTLLLLSQTRSLCLSTVLLCTACRRGSESSPFQTSLTVGDREAPPPTLTCCCLKKLLPHTSCGCLQI